MVTGSMISSPKMASPHWLCGGNFLILNSVYESVKTLSYLILALTVAHCSAQKLVDTLVVNNTIFIAIQKTATNEFIPQTPDTLVYFYRLENGQNTYLLKHYTYKFTADCNNEFEDIGTYQVKGDSIIFNTEYTQKRNDPIPLSRQQIYVVKSTGKLILVSDREKDYSGKWGDTIR